MSKSKPTAATEGVDGRVVLIQQRDELADFADLLTRLGIPIESRGGRPLPRPGDVAQAGLIVIPAGLLLEGGAPNLSLWPRTVAVVDDASRTLLSHLNRVGAALVIHRPIHPRTLRLLLLHEIYRGPERRTRKRILIGHPIRVVSGLFKQRATLCELSPDGARIELPGTPKIGSKLRILIGKDLTGGKPLKLQAKVMRCIRPSGEEGRRDAEIGVELINPKQDRQAIASVLQRYARGPAAWAGKSASQTSTSDTPVLASIDETETTTDSGIRADQDGSGPPGETIDPEASARRLPPSHRPARSESPNFIKVTGTSQRRDATIRSASAEATAKPTAAPASADASDRRSETRVTYDRRVVALGQEAARVLVGRDLSHGGMRIASNEAIHVGDAFRIALHGGSEAEPIVVNATALRDDGEDGLVLSFGDLSASQREQLDELLATTASIHSVGDEADGAGSIVVGEMLDMLEREGGEAHPA